MHKFACVKSILTLTATFMITLIAHGDDISTLSDLTALRPDTADDFTPNTEVLVGQGSYTDLLKPDQLVGTASTGGPNYTGINQVGSSNQATVLQGAGRLNVLQSGFNNNAAVDSQLFVH
jgi:hypothetical protein